jgi:hypothetical protein
MVAKRIVIATISYCHNTFMALKRVKGSHWLIKFLALFYGALASLKKNHAYVVLAAGSVHARLQAGYWHTGRSCAAPGV